MRLSGEKSIIFWLSSGFNKFEIFSVFQLYFVLYAQPFQTVCKVLLIEQSWFVHLSNKVRDSQINIFFCEIAMQMCTLLFLFLSYIMQNSQVKMIRVFSLVNLVCWVFLQLKTTGWARKKLFCKGLKLFLVIKENLTKIGKFLRTFC